MTPSGPDDPINLPGVIRRPRTRLEVLAEKQQDLLGRAKADDAALSDENRGPFFNPGDIENLRLRLALSPAGFAERFGIGLRTLLDWEQGRREPDLVARSYLRVISVASDAVARALAAE